VTLSAKFSNTFYYFQLPFDLAVFCRLLSFASGEYLILKSDVEEQATPSTAFSSLLNWLWYQNLRLGAARIDAWRMEPTENASSRGNETREDLWTVECPCRKKPPARISQNLSHMLRWKWPFKEGHIKPRELQPNTTSLYTRLVSGTRRRWHVYCSIHYYYIKDAWI
jgi:hypothetical protein